MESYMEKFPVYEAHELSELEVDGLFVVRGLSRALQEQLVEKSRQAHIVATTPRDSRERFTDVAAVQEQVERKSFYALAEKQSGTSEQLAGIVWLGEKPHEGSNWTFAIRLYGGYTGRRLSEPFMETALGDFNLLHPEAESVWLSVHRDNAPARHLYEKTGFIATIDQIEEEREIMVKLLNAKNPKIVVIGGGTGSFTVLTGLKRYTENITAVVNMSDNGGSSGRLRDELGVLPPGDINQCLAALSENEALRDMLKVRFKDGQQAVGEEHKRRLGGHSWGNLTLSLLVQQHNNDFEAGLAAMSDILAVRGEVCPVTLTDTTLVARRLDGTVIRGELEVSRGQFGGERPAISLEPQAVITDSARRAIEQADIVVVAPGSLYGSLAPALVVGGIKEALEATEAKRVYVSNLVTKPGQTENFKVHDYAAEVERFIRAPLLDYVLFNTDEPTPSMEDQYMRDGEYMLEFDLEELAKQHYQAIGLPLIAKDPLTHDASDILSNQRTLIRHDADLLAREIIALLSR